MDAKKKEAHECHLNFFFFYGLCDSSTFILLEKQTKTVHFSVCGLGDRKYGSPVESLTGETKLREARDSLGICKHSGHDVDV